MLGSTNEEQSKKILQKWHFQTARKLGKGSFGHVFLASKFVNSSSVFYAVKCISLKKTAKDPKLKVYISQQTDTMNSLDHPNIVRLENTLSQSGWYFFIMEYCDMGNLLQYQSKLPNKIFPVSDAVKFFNQILKGVQVIHSKNILHRDIKCQNIFLKKKKSGGLICKIGDFGFAKVIQDNTKTNCGTTIYMAPEVLALNPYNFQADIWSLGVVLFQMIFGEYPFKSLNIEKQIRQKCHPEYRLANQLHLQAKIPKKYFAFCEDLFRRIFTLNPKERITLKQIMEHPLIRKQDQVSSDSTSDDSKDSEAEWEKNRINYMKKILAQIKKQQFLEPYLQNAFTFYIHKVIKMFLKETSIVKFVKQQPNSKLSTQIKVLKAENEDQLYSSMKLLEKHQFMLKKIQNFYDGFNLSFEDFVSFKQGYRNTVGAIFQEIHKKINDPSKRSRLKFKVFTCHLINRIFKTGVNKQIFPKFQTWVKQNGKKRSALIKFADFQSWIGMEYSENLLSSIEEINNIFYRKE